MHRTRLLPLLVKVCGTISFPIPALRFAFYEGVVTIFRMFFFLMLYGKLVFERKVVKVYHVILLLICVSRSESTRLNSSHANISYAVFCLKKKNTRATSSTTITPHS